MSLVRWELRVYSFPTLFFCYDVQILPSIPDLYPGGGLLGSKNGEQNGKAERCGAASKSPFSHSTWRADPYDSPLTPLEPFGIHAKDCKMRVLSESNYIDTMYFYPTRYRDGVSSSFDSSITIHFQTLPSKRSFERITSVSTISKIFFSIEVSLGHRVGINDPTNQ